jgi:hypothetical protein
MIRPKFAFSMSGNSSCRMQLDLWHLCRSNWVAVAKLFEAAEISHLVGTESNARDVGARRTRAVTGAGASPVSTGQRRHWRSEDVGHGSFGADRDGTNKGVGSRPRPLSALMGATSLPSGSMRTRPPGTVAPRPASAMARTAGAASFGTSGSGPTVHHVSAARRDARPASAMAAAH